MQSGSLWAIEPGQRVGPFRIGQHVNQSLRIAQKYRQEIELAFSESTSPHSIDVVIRLPTLGLQLNFDGYTQALHVIIVWIGPLDTDGNSPRWNATSSDDTSRKSKDKDDALSQGPPPNSPQRQLSYCGRVFSGIDGTTPVMSDIYSLFGPSYLGDFHRGCDGPSYLLKYPGLSFEFMLPEDQFDELSALGEHPIEIPRSDSRSESGSPLARKLWVFPASSQSFLQPSLLDVIEHVIVKVGVGILSPCKSTRDGKEGRFSSAHMIRLGCNPQDVLSDLGPPDQVTIKDFDHMKVHQARSVAQQISGRQTQVKSGGQGAPNPDYYYNYYSLGIDILFEGASHEISKILLYQNPPTHEQFGRHARCFFQIPIDCRKTAASSEGGGDGEKQRRKKKNSQSQQQAPRDEKSQNIGNAQNSQNCIDPRWNWTKIQEALGTCGRPLVVNQPYRYSGINNPFGSTHFYAYPGVIFEVMSNGFLASVTIFPVAQDDILPAFQEDTASYEQSKGSAFSAPYI